MEDALKDTSINRISCLGSGVCVCVRAYGMCAYGVCAYGVCVCVRARARACYCHHLGDLFLSLS